MNPEQIVRQLCAECGYGAAVLERAIVYVTIGNPLASPEVAVKAAREQEHIAERMVAACPEIYGPGGLMDRRAAANNWAPPFYWVEVRERQAVRREQDANLRLEPEQVISSPKPVTRNEMAAPKRANFGWDEVIARLNAQSGMEPPFPK
jgi:hypothetical protein